MTNQRRANEPARLILISTNTNCIAYVCFFKFAPARMIDPPANFRRRWVMKVRVVQAETGGRSSSSLSQTSKDKTVASSHRGRPPATPRENICDCGFLKSSVDAKEDILDKTATAEYGTHMLNGNVRRWWRWWRLGTELEDRIRDGGRRAEARW